jgi:uncharacterized protein (DUF952 family)
MCRQDEWRAAAVSGVYQGSSQDVADGFIHFSTVHQVHQSAAKHRAGQEGLVLLAVSAGAVRETLKWEPAGSGELFPHLHGPLPVTAVMAVYDLPLAPDGFHRFPLLDD